MPELAFAERPTRQGGGGYRTGYDRRNARVQTTLGPINSCRGGYNTTPQYDTPPKSRRVGNELKASKTSGFLMKIRNQENQNVIIIKNVRVSPEKSEINIIRVSESSKFDRVSPGNLKVRFSASNTDSHFQLLL